MFWKSVVGKLWMTIIVLVAIVLLILGMFLLEYIEMHFANSNDVKNLFYITAVIGFLLTTFFAFFLSTKITRPLLQLKEAADQVAKGDYNMRVNIRSSDEIGELARTYNHMAHELKRLITALSHEKEHLSSVLRSMNDAVVTFDAVGNVISANPQGERLIEEWSRIADWDKEGEASLDATFQSSTSTQIPYPLRALFQSIASGSEEKSSKLNVLNGVWSVVMTPLYSANAIRGAVAVLRDVTEEHRLEKLRKDFVANVSHELRTPLSLMQGYSEAVLDDMAATPEERKQLVQVIHDESLRMRRLVHDLLDLATMEAGHLELKLIPVDAAVLLKRVYRKFLTLAKERNIEMHLSLDESRPEILMLNKADEDRMEQVLTNLLDNALRHSADGAHIYLSAGHTQLRNNRAIKIEIVDEGAGIPKEDLPYIFERFYKADKARTRANSGGTGLGLAIVKNIIDAHKGEISVASEPGKGTTFSIVLPAY